MGRIGFMGWRRKSELRGNRNVSTKIPWDVVYGDEEDVWGNAPETDWVGE